MNLLAMETATELVGAAVGETTDASRARAEVWTTGRRRHAESLVPAIDEALGLAGVALSDLDALAVDVGPGLFTGLRVGVATAKGLAQSLGIGILSVTSLAALAHAAFESGSRSAVLSVVDARRGQLFAALFGPASNTSPITALVAPHLCTPDDLAGEAACSQRRHGSLLAVGDGARRYAGLLAAVPGVQLAGQSFAHPRPASVGALAAAQAASGCPLLGAEDLEPLYLRDADARPGWDRRSTATGAR